MPKVGPVQITLLSGNYTTGANQAVDLTDLMKKGNFVVTPAFIYKSDKVGNANTCDCKLQIAGDGSNYIDAGVTFTQGNNSNIHEAKTAGNYSPGAKIRALITIGSTGTYNIKLWATAPGWGGQGN